MATLGTPDRGTCYHVSHIIGLLQPPGRTFMYLGVTGGRGNVFVMALLQVTLLNASLWNVAEGRWGQKNIQPPPPQKKLLI